MIAINKEFALCTIKCHLQTGKHQLAAVSHAWFCSIFGSEHVKGSLSFTKCVFVWPCQQHPYRRLVRTTPLISEGVQSAVLS